MSFGPTKIAKRFTPSPPTATPNVRLFLVRIGEAGHRILHRLDLHLPFRKRHGCEKSVLDAGEREIAGVETGPSLAGFTSCTISLFCAGSKWRLCWPAAAFVDAGVAKTAAPGEQVRNRLVPSSTSELTCVR